MVKWVEGYSISNDFTVRIWARDLNENKTIATFTSTDNTNIVMQYMVDDEDDTRVYLSVLVESVYYIYSQSIPKPLDTDYLCIQLRRINNVYEIEFSRNVTDDWFAQLDKTWDIIKDGTWQDLLK